MQPIKTIFMVLVLAMTMRHSSACRLCSPQHTTEDGHRKVLLDTAWANHKSIPC